MDANCKILRLVNNNFSSKLYGIKPKKLYDISLQKYYINLLNCIEIHFPQNCLEDLNESCQPYVVQESGLEFAYIYTLLYTELKGDLQVDAYPITLEILKKGVINYNSPETYSDSFINPNINFTVDCEDSIIVLPPQGNYWTLNTYNKQVKQYEYLTRFRAEVHENLYYKESSIQTFNLNYQDYNLNVDFAVFSIIKMDLHVSLEVTCLKTPLLQNRYQLELVGIEDYYIANSLNLEGLEGAYYHWEILPTDEVYPYVFVGETLKFSKLKKPIVSQHPNFVGLGKLRCTVFDGFNNVALICGNEGIPSTKIDDYLEIYYLI